MKTIEQLRRKLKRLRLVDLDELQECLREMPKGTPLDDALAALERSQLLTSYQSNLLRKGQTDGLIIGDYKLLYRNASGSFARVYRACSISDGSTVAMKVLRQRWSKDETMVAQFRREANVVKRLQHPNIVPILEVGRQKDYHFFTMEFVEGGNLRDFIKIRRKVEPIEALRCGLDMVEGLSYALSKNATHRDLKMTNVLMSVQGVAKLVDFGLAGDDSGTGRYFGDDVQRALEYATLEKGTNAPANDPRSDLFFLGGILYELLSGEPPWSRTRDRQQKKQLSRYQNVVPLTRSDPGIPPAVVAIVERLMQVNPEERYQNYYEVIRDLKATQSELEGGKPVEVPAESAAGTSIMVVEHRQRNQDVLRDYLGKHGFRVMMTGDADRAVQRLRSKSPPACVLMIGESIGDEVVDWMKQARSVTRRNSRVIGLFSEKQSALCEQVTEDLRMRVIKQPVTLRELRKRIEMIVKQTSFGPVKDEQHEDAAE